MRARIVVGGAGHELYHHLAEGQLLNLECPFEVDNIDEKNPPFTIKASGIVTVPITFLGVVDD